MLTTEPFEHTDASVSRPGGGERGRSLFGRVIGYSLLIAFVAVVVAAVVFSLKISEGVSRDLGSSSLVVRLQVVNSSGIRGLGARMASQLTGYADSDLEIHVVDTSDFDAVKVARSFVIARTESGKEAKALAVKLGLDPSTVVTKLLEHDTRLISATLVIGEDYGIIVLKRKTS